MKQLGVTVGYFVLVLTLCISSLNHGALPFLIVIPLATLLPALIAGLRAGRGDARQWLALSACGIVAPFLLAIGLAVAGV
jgi:predicted neuraminidase